MRGELCAAPPRNESNDVEGLGARGYPAGIASSRAQAARIGSLNTLKTTLKTSFSPIMKRTALLSFITAIYALAAPAQASIGHETKSIRQWVKCDGISNDAAGLAAALDAARQNAFTLIVDCPVRLSIGKDIDRTQFIEDGTSVEFTGVGQFIVDNILHPAFVIANSKDIDLTNWNILYDASLPVDWNVGGYERSGRAVSAAGYAQPAAAFHDSILTPWMAAHRHIAFDKSQGNVGALWMGPTNTSSLFYIVGDTSHVRVSGLKVHVPPSAGGDRFVPMVFSMTMDYKNNQTVTANTPKTAQYMAVPHDIEFSDIDFDGIYMGWQGTAQNVSFRHIRSYRYGDLQDAAGNNVGGLNKWFAPPHLIYLNYAVNGDPQLFTKNIQIKDVIDSGPRVGTARDRGGLDTVSGHALSLKIGCVSCTVDGYSSSRPDGFLDVLPSDGLTISNVTATFDSDFLHGVLPGWRFPGGPYKNLVFENITLTDSAASSTQLPIGATSQASNEGFVFRNVHVIMNKWAGKGSPIPVMAGQGHDISLDYSFGDGTHIVSSQKSAVSLILQSSETRVRNGDSPVVTWTSKGADGCVASGAWEGPLADSGTRAVRLGNSGATNLTVKCRGTSDSATATLHFALSP